MKDYRPDEPNRARLAEEVFMREFEVIQTEG